MRLGALLLASLVIVVAVALALGVGLTGPPPGVAAAGAPRFVEEAQPGGVTHAYDGDFEYFVGGGVAVFDCNDDGLPDLYLAGGSKPAALFVNGSEPGGALAFDQLRDPTTDVDAVTGAYPIDIDGDGLIDLAVLRRGENLMLRGTGECRFERANERWSFDGMDAWSTAFSARWDPGAAWPTIAVGNYLDQPTPDNNARCAPNLVYAPDPAGTAFGAPVELAPGWCTLSMLFSDWDRSGRRDLRVTNDRHYYSDYSEGGEQLWRIEPESAPREYTEQDGWQRLRVFGMGIASYDVTGDGYPDYYLTSQGDNKLQTLAGGALEPRFMDIALRAGATVQRPYEGDTIMPSTAWHPEFGDVNNDGLADLFVAKGNVEAQEDHAERDPSNLLLGQPDGTFVEGAIDAGLVDYGRARGGALVDLNADGLLDLVIVDRRENTRLYRSLGSASASESGSAAQMGNWLSVRVSQPTANRDAIGAWIEVDSNGLSLQREVTIGGGHVSGELGPIHFGLGAAENARVRVTWPDGEIGAWQTFAANQVVEVTR